MISIVIPLYNDGDVLSLTLDAILDNDYSDYEIIIVNDASTDDSQKVVDVYVKNHKNISCVKLKENKGAAHARNTGIDYAKGELVMFIDADVIVPKHTLKTFVNSKEDITVGIYSKESVFSNIASRYKNEFLYQVHYSITDRFWTGCIAVKKYVFEKVKFDKSIKGANVEDTDFGYRCQEQGFSLKTDLSVQVKHNHKHTLWSVLNNDFSKAKGFSSVKNQKLIGEYVNFRLYWNLRYFFPMLVLSMFAGGLGYFVGKLNNSHFKYLKNLFSKKQLVQLTLFVTNRCNLKCAHCLNKSLNVEKDLSLSSIKKLSREMPEFMYLLISGGEPFLRDDLSEIVNTFYANNNILNTVIVTNGSFPQKIVKQTQDILSKYRNHLVVDISIDGLEFEHDSIRGLKGSFKNAVKTIKLLKSLKNPNLQVGVIMTMTKKNEKSLLRVYDYVKSLGVDSIALNLVRSKPEQLPNMNLYKKLSDKIKSDNKNFSGFFMSSLNRSLKNVVRNNVIKTVNKGYQSRCYAGLLNVVVANNGNVYPCEMLDKSFGNIKKSGFDKIWNGKQAKETRLFIKKSKCHCTEECNMNVNILFNLKFYPKLFFNFLLKK